MAKIFKPRRGKKSTMAGSKKATVLSAGEMFIEVPDTGAGTGHSKMKIGDGSTQYSSLPYAMGDTENDKIAFSNDTSGNITTALNKVTSGAALKTMIAALKQAVSLANTSITQLNDETNNINVYIGEDGKLHFVDKDGADTVLNFSNNTNPTTLYGHTSTNTVETRYRMYAGYKRYKNLHVKGYGTLNAAISLSFMMNNGDETRESLPLFSIPGASSNTPFNDEKIIDISSDEYICDYLVYQCRTYTAGRPDYTCYFEWSATE